MSCRVVREREREREREIEKISESMTNEVAKSAHRAAERRKTVLLSLFFFFFFFFFFKSMPGGGVGFGWDEIYTLTDHLQRWMN